MPLEAQSPVSGNHAQLAALTNRAHRLHENAVYYSICSPDFTQSTVPGSHDESPSIRRGRFTYAVPTPCRPNPASLWL